MDLTGARWSMDGAESILKLRSIVKGGAFEEYWSYHLRGEHKRNTPKRNLKPAQKPAGTTELGGCYTSDREGSRMLDHLIERAFDIAVINSSNEALVIYEIDAF